MRVITAPMTGVASVTPSDSTVIATTHGLMVSVAGDVAVQFEDGSTATIASAIAGVVYPFAVTKVLSTGTAATGILALY
ncbi:spike base protein, RCAP_Rcc01079 family [Paenibacillus harenae]|uniref:spike base protein, RCAP_Rcc01079 family n=1 Tax=Paenibacillus harenae TaxID=306543 RepID=UPI00278CF54D|nr:hypothetical protein [Paenibacillus harenae]MDQ0062385.1 hypothetical protein [Paenibacillus harenae]